MRGGFAGQKPVRAPQTYSGRITIRGLTEAAPLSFFEASCSILGSAAGKPVNRARISITGSAAADFVPLARVSIVGSAAGSQVPIVAGVDWAASRRVVIPEDHVAGTANLSDYIFLFDQTVPGLRLVANGGLVQSAAGWDIRFELADGTKLDHDIGSFNPVTGALVAWVRVPTVSATTGAILVVKYGKPGLVASEANPGGCWRNYGAVHDTVTGIDRTGQGRNLGGVFGVGAGTLAGPAGDFDGVSSQLQGLTPVPWFNGLSALTVETWWRADTIGHNGGIVAIGGGAVAAQELSLRFADPSNGGAVNSIQGSLNTSAGSTTVEAPAQSQKAAAFQSGALRWSSGQAPTLVVDGAQVTPANTPTVRTGTTAFGTDTSIRIGRHAAAAVPVQQPGRPFPDTTEFAQVTALTNIARMAQGTDQTPSTERADGSLLIAGADGDGWNGNRTPKSFLEIYRAPPTAVPPTMAGVVDMWRHTTTNIKPQGLLAVGNSEVLLWYCNFEGQPTRRHTYFSRSTDGGANFTLYQSDLVFDKLAGDFFQPICVLQVGPGYSASTQGEVDLNYAYLIGNIRGQGHSGDLWSSAPDASGVSSLGSPLYMARVKFQGGVDTPDRCRFRANYTWFAGLDANRLPTWTATAKGAAWATIPAGIGRHIYVGWQPVYNKWMMCWCYAVNRVGIALNDNPFDPAGWRMLAYDEQTGITANEMLFGAFSPQRWNTAAQMWLHYSPYPNAGFTAPPGDDFIINRGAMSILPGGATDGFWPGLIGQVRFRGANVPTAVLQTQHDNYRAPLEFHGLGGEDLFTDANESPVAVPMQAAVTAGQQVDLALLARSHSPSGATLTISYSNVSRGTVTTVGALTRYVPGGTAAGVATFDYTVSDGNRSDTARVDVTIAAQVVVPPTGVTLAPYMGRGFGCGGAGRGAFETQILSGTTISGICPRTGTLVGVNYESASNQSSTENKSLGNGPYTFLQRFCRGRTPTGSQGGANVPSIPDFAAVLASANASHNRGSNGANGEGRRWRRWNFTGFTVTQGLHYHIELREGGGSGRISTNSPALRNSSSVVAMAPYGLTPPRRQGIAWGDHDHYNLFLSGSTWQRREGFLGHFDWIYSDGFSHGFAYHLGSTGMYDDARIGGSRRVRQRWRCVLAAPMTVRNVWFWCWWHRTQGSIPTSDLTLTLFEEGATAQSWTASRPPSPTTVSGTDVVKPWDEALNGYPDWCRFDFGAARPIVLTPGRTYSIEATSADGTRLYRHGPISQTWNTGYWTQDVVPGSGTNVWRAAVGSADTVPAFGQFTTNGGGFWSRFRLFTPQDPPDSADDVSLQLWFEKL